MSDTDPSPVDFGDERTAGGTPKGPVTADGIAWKPAAGLLVVLVGIGVSWGALNAKLDYAIERIDTMAQVQVEDGRWIAGAKVRLDAVEHALKRGAR